MKMKGCRRRSTPFTPQSRGVREHTHPSQGSPRTRLPFPGDRTKYRGPQKEAAGLDPPSNGSEASSYSTTGCPTSADRPHREGRYRPPSSRTIRPHTGRPGSRVSRWRRVDSRRAAPRHAADPREQQPPTQPGGPRWPGGGAATATGRGCRPARRVPRCVPLDDVENKRG
jgi:hypothetical protein